MPDLLISLNGQGGVSGWDVAQPAVGMHVRRALAYERQLVLGWVERSFSAGWAGEVAVALGVQPTTCFLAVGGTNLAGFCCYDATYRGFLGPLGVREVYRGRGIGRALLHAALHAMWHAGYAYAVVGASGATGFYAKVAGAREISGSDAGSYPPRLRDHTG